MAVLPSGGEHLVSRTTDLTLEAMRRRLARMAFDVHDGPMQELIALSYGLQALQKKVAESSTEIRSTASPSSSAARVWSKPSRCSGR